jgi:hypothetical protein
LLLIPCNALLALCPIPGCHTRIEGIRIRATCDRDTGVRMAENNGFSIGGALREALERLSGLFDKRPPSFIEGTSGHHRGEQHDHEQGPACSAGLGGRHLAISIVHSVGSFLAIRGIVGLLLRIGRCLPRAACGSQPSCLAWHGVVRCPSLGTRPVRQTMAARRPAGG